MKSPPATGMLLIRHSYSSLAIGNGKTMQIDGNYGVLLINLTSVFGLGNEPTKEEMNLLLILLGGWFDGEITPNLRRRPIL